MTELQRAQGCLLGLACGDALGRPVEFKSADEIQAEHGEVTEMLAYGTHGQPAGTITDDTEMALRIADSLVERRGFDPADIGERFVEWLESDPFDIGLMTRDALLHLRQGTPWNEAGAEVWEQRPEGSNAGNGSVMRCAPHALAFRNFNAELTHVSRLSSAITHADPRCQWGCVFLNRTLANLIHDVDSPLESALQQAYRAPDELRTALQRVQEIQTAESERTEFECELSTTGYVVDSLQAGLYYGLTAESVEHAVTRSVNEGGDTDTVGAIAGAVAGARFGVNSIPERWRAEIEDADRITHLAQRLLSIRNEWPEKAYVTLDDGSLVFKGRTVEGPTYIPASEFQDATIGHRPHPAPHRTIQADYHELTPQLAAMLDWERRAYAVDTGRSTAYTGPDIDLDTGDQLPQRDFVPVPQYPFVDSFDALPEIDQQRIMQDAREAAKAFIRAYTAFAAIRHPITETNTEHIGIERMDQIAGATRVLVRAFDEFGDHLLATSVGGGNATPDDVENTLNPADVEHAIAEQPSTILHVQADLADLSSGASAILDYLTHIEPVTHQSTFQGNPVADLQSLREEARTVVGELSLISEALHRVAVRHPGINLQEWTQTPN
jgi:ADP-ribosyl-[dinitrogen reductase] hydrolase